MISAKSTSLMGQIVGAVLLIAGFALKGVNVIDLSGWDIFLCALGTAGMFAPVYLSIIIDKIKGNDTAGGKQ